MGLQQVSGVAGVTGTANTTGTTGTVRQSAANTAREQRTASSTPTVAEMMKEAREKADARRDQFQRIKPRQSYGTVPVEAYARLARARNQAGVNAAASFARRKIVQLQSAKRTDSENAQQIQGAINQLRKAVHRANRKKQELTKEQVAQKRQAKLAREKKLREAKRQRLELQRTQSLRVIRESGYVREAETDGRMHTYMAKTQMELREQAQALSAKVAPALDTAVQQYAAAAGTAAAGETTGGEISTQA